MEKALAAIKIIVAVGTLIFIIQLLIPSKCEVPGCPADASSRSDYCIRHKCANSSCDNRAVLEGGDGYLYYCQECLDEA